VIQPDYLEMLSDPRGPWPITCYLGGNWLHSSKDDAAATAIKRDAIHTPRCGSGTVIGPGFVVGTPRNDDRRGRRSILGYQPPSAKPSADNDLLTRGPGGIV
jgi:hypothetical protein